MARETGDTAFHETRERPRPRGRLQSLCALRFFSTASLGSSGLAEPNAAEPKRARQVVAAAERGCCVHRTPPSRSLHSGACPRLGSASAAVSVVSASAARQLCTRARARAFANKAVTCFWARESGLLSLVTLLC